MRLTCLFLVAELLLCPVAATATTYLVRPDGTGDVPTIQAGVLVAVDGDVLLLADGTFTGPGNRDVDLMGKGIAIESASGNAQTCILDCEGTPEERHRAFQQRGPCSAAIRISRIGVRRAFCDGAAVNLMEQANVEIIGCIFERNDGTWGGAVLCAGSSAVIDGCEFTGNHSRDAGGAIQCYSCSPTIRDCVFRDNSSVYCGGAIDTHYDCDPQILRCLFAGNRCAHEGGAIRCGYRTTTRIEGCTFLDNEAHWGGAISCYLYASPTVTACTFYHNAASFGSALFCDTMTTAQLASCILAGGGRGEALACRDAFAATLRCCDIFGNEGGDWIGCAEGQLGVDGNISADPLFCDPGAGDFHLQEGSPCAPGATCDLIGAWPVACAPTSIEVSSWGSIKAGFR